jgi:hypothetical protein
MREELSITGMIAQEKILLDQINRELSGDFNFMTYYQKNRPFVGARKAEDQEKHQTEKLQRINDMLRRFQAIRSAHCKANRETMVEVPEEPRLENFLKGKEQGTESITIAEAINRKNLFLARNMRKHDVATFSDILTKMVSIYNNDFNARERVEQRMTQEVDRQMDAKFPRESKNSWSIEKYNEERERLLAESAIQTIDPKGIIQSDAINKYNAAVQNYLTQIDFLISQVNGSTICTIEY